VLAWLPPFAWYVPIANSRRYLFPVVAVAGPAFVGWLVVAVRGAWPRAAAAGDTVLDRSFVLLAHPLVVLVAAAALVGAELREAQRPPAGGPRVPFTQETLRVADALRRWPPGTRVLAGPAATVPSPWLVYPHAIYTHLPSRLDGAAAERWIRTEADVVLLSPNLVSRRPTPFREWASLRGDGALIATAPPAWATPWGMSGPPEPHYLLYRVTP
jgi:hypothetical protein